MRELEIVGLAAADGLAGPRPAKPGDGPKHANLHPEWVNCKETMHGRYCCNCGQTDDDHHRSIFHLIWEAVEGFTHLDGRLARTLPPLFFRPARLIRDHLEGRRQRHVPPFRLFLITLLLFMFSLELATHNGGEGHKPAAPPVASHVTAPTPPTPPDLGQKPAPAPAAEKPDADDADLPRPTKSPTQEAVHTEAPTPAQPVPVVTRGKDGSTTVDVGSTHFKVGVEPPKGGLVQFNGDVDQGFDKMVNSKKPVLRWLGEHGRKAMASKEYFRSIMFEWGHRLAVLLLPIFAGFLTLFYFYKRRFYVYDHLVVAMHFLSFTFLLWGAVYLLPEPVNGFAMLIATVWTPVNLFMILRGAYGSSIVGAAVKALSLWIATLFLFLALLMGVVMVALGSI